MKSKTYRRLAKLLATGKLNKLEKELAPFLAERDLDARFLNLHFSSSSISDEAFDARMVDELHQLSAELHHGAMVELAWLYKLGDGVSADYAKFKDLLAAAALLGNERARQNLAIFLESDLGYSGLAARFPQPSGK